MEEGPSQHLYLVLHNSCQDNFESLCKKAYYQLHISRNLQHISKQRR